MPAMAKLVTLDLARRKLYVDGAEFPWLISEAGPQLNDLAANNQVRSVTLTFFCDDVVVIPENPQHVGER